MAQDATATAAQFDQALDARGLNCPLPVLRAKVMLNRMAPGEVLRVEATDPHASIDFQAYCARTRHEIIGQSEHDGVIVFLIRRAASPVSI